MRKKIDSLEELVDLAIVSQPVVQALVVSQILNGQEICLQFFANRFFMRPFIYFTSCDLMLTTVLEYRWRDINRLHLKGTVMMALLLQSSKDIVYDSFAPGVCLKLGFPETRFSKALKESAYAAVLNHSSLHSMTFKELAVENSSEVVDSSKFMDIITNTCNEFDS